MSEQKNNLTRAWLEKAARDIGSARKLASGSDSYLDTAVYHCQQAAEKAVKAFLVFHDIRFGKTHDIEELVEEAATVNSGFLSWADAGATLTPYATLFRYPQEYSEPGKEEFDEALECAGGLYGFVLSLLPAETHPEAQI
ncbi:MAG: HEPN domain-containing protein [Nitrospirae bacterium]|nr:HEPN domain-containing protein [Nitrospirota bacterium]